MPEIKNTFLQGKMNKDLDERLVPNGQYRDAMNVEVATAEDSDIGTVKNILGNHRVEELVGVGFVCVGSIADEKTNKLYWFISSYEKDVILEYDGVNDVALPVVVDLNAGNFKAVLKFSGNIITGINIIDNLLFWTDNNSEPKKINIDICKAGTDPSGDIHTQLEFKNGSFNGVTAELVSPSPLPTLVSGSDDIRYSDNGQYLWAEQKQIEKLFPKEIIDDTTNNVIPFTYDTSEFDASNPYNIRHYRNGKFLGVKQVTVQGVDRDTGNPSWPFGNTIKSHLDDFIIGDVIFGDNLTIDLEERHITVVRPKPLNAPAVKINHSENSNSARNIPNLFETKFPRFSYRYKFRDGEYSTFAPFTVPVFNPKYPKDTSASKDTNIFYNKDNAYDIKEPYNKAMINSIHSIELTDFVSAKTPEDAIEIEILYKQEESSVIYSIGTIKHVDPEWHATSNHENAGASIGIGKADFPRAFQAEGGYTKGRYTVTTENIYAALPANQLLRPWDNVPKKALAQEITGNRIVYGNYVQNYDLNQNTQVSVGYSDRNNTFSNFETQALPSIKSQRNYQLGVVYCDKYGRETPVFTSDHAALNVPWQDGDGSKNASKSLQLNVSTPVSFPEWVDSLKFFIKESSNQYYNLIMDRAWVTKRTYELDNSEGHMWISFPSSDRNKISEEDYIILKKKVGTGEGQVAFENKFKVIDIKNEAPDAIKYELVTYSVIHNEPLSGSTSYNRLAGDKDNSLFRNGHRRPDREVDVLWCNKNMLVNHQTAVGPFEILGQVPLHEDQETPGEGPIKTKDLYVSWSRISDNSEGDACSKKYKIIGGSLDSSKYTLRLANKITRIDADIAHVNGASDGDDTKTNLLHPDLVFKVEKKQLKDSEDFSGKFFVKISKNQITDLIENGSPVSILDKFQVRSKTSIWYWQDYLGPSNSNYEYSTDDSSYGMTNYEGQRISYAGDYQNWLHYTDTSNPTNNGWGNAAGDGTDTRTDGEMRVTDFATPWKNMRNNTSSFGPTFFIDSVHMAAGQSEASDYAKYCCVTWSGATAGQEKSAEDSSWSYPPLKTWITDFGDTTGFLTARKEKLNVGGDIRALRDIVQGKGGNRVRNKAMINQMWLDNNLISASPGLPENEDYDGLRIDGWVGPLQGVSRSTPQSDWHRGDNHVNGLEGLVTTSENHSKGPRRWFSGITGSKTDYGVGTDTKAYADNHDDVGRHFMHLSFFAPGKDLHNGNWNSLYDDDATGMIYGSNGFGANLQGIWGGGVFTGEEENETFGDTTDPAEKYLHFPMEGNYDDSLNYLPETPGPGVGFGYDVKYRELHERQWDPTFNINGDDNNEIRDFIRNLHPGSKFRFNRVGTNSVIDDTVYTIKKVQIKKLYNHTSWRKPYNRHVSRANAVYTYLPSNGSEHEVYRSVEEQAMYWLDSVMNGGIPGASNANGADQKAGIRAYPNEGLTQKITDFGASHNRRVCYIIELDKNPADSDSSMGHPLSQKVGGKDALSADFHNGDYTDIEFLDPVQDYLLSDLSKFPAIWELDPKKQEVDLDIYYEASSNIPVNINKDTNELFAPIGCKVEIVDSPTTSASTLLSWDNHTMILDPGFPQGTSGTEIDYSGRSFKFTRQDGSYTTAEAGRQDLSGVTTGLRTKIVIREDIGEVISSGLAWSNCFSFGNGIESNRVKDDFNEPFITNGVKASTTIQETYQEERRKNGLIYSGIYNSNSGVNDLNQFIMAEKITKDLNPTYGSIQKLFSRNTDLVTFCEDKVLKVLANKDAVFNADGNPQLTANENVLGQTIPFVGEYGIATNPESFASESYRAYFTDKQRGAVLRLSKDGLTPISKAGMNDWFRDNLSRYHSLIGTYDSYKEGYNLTLSNIPEFSENFILDSYLDTGEALEAYTLGSLSLVSNPGIANGVSLHYIFEQSKVNSYSTPVNAFDWPAFTQASYDLTATVSVIHHVEMLAGDIKPAVPEILPGSQQTQSNWEVIATNPATGQQQSFTGYGSTSAAAEQNAIDAGYTQGIQTTNFEPATYTSSLPESGSGVSGRFWHGDFAAWTGDIWGNSYLSGSSGGMDIDPFIHGYIRRNHGGSYGYVNESQSTPGTDPLNAKYWGTWDSQDPAVEKLLYFGIQGSNGNYVSNCITRNAGTNNIMFDRVLDDDAFIETNNTGSPPTSVNIYNVGGLNYDIGEPLTSNSNLPPNFPLTFGQTGTISGNLHRKVYNGDEIHVEIELKCFPTYVVPGDPDYPGSYPTQYIGFGQNYIIPKIELRDGANEIDSNKIWKEDAIGVGGQWYNGMKNPMSSPGGSSFEYVHTDGDSASGGNGTFEFSGFSRPSGTNYYADSNSVTFPNTNTINGLRWAHSQNRPAPHETTDSKTVIIRASWKFIDPDQQKSFGPKKNGVDHIRTRTVVDDLKVRLSLPRGGTTGGYWVNNTYSSGTTPYKQMAYPLVEVKNMKITKAFGVDTSSVQPNYDPFTGIETASQYPYGQHAVDAIPPVKVPAWTEVIHHGLTSSWNHPDSHGYWWSRLPGKFGQTYNRVEITQQSKNVNNISQPPNVPVKYSVPYDWDHSLNPNPAYLNLGQGDAPRINDTAHNNYGHNGSAHQPTGIGAHGLVFNRKSETNNNYDRSNTSSAPALVTYNEQYFHASSNASGSTHLIYDLPSGSHWGYGAGIGWYLVDVEFDNTYEDGIPANPGNPDLKTEYSQLVWPNTRVMVLGVADHTNFNYTNGVDINPEYGVGYFDGSGSANNPSDNYLHVGLVPTKRTEYGRSDGSGDNKVVLRGIFKIDSSSNVMTQGPSWATYGKASNQFALRVYNANNGLRINRIIAKRLSHSYLSTWASTSGTAEKWALNDGIGNTNTMVHMFQKKHIYFQRPGLCWQVPADKNDGQYFWTQEFGTANTSQPPTVSNKGWELRFTVNNNPRTDNFSGKLKGYITIDDGSGNHEGLYFEDIQHEGNYLIKFNFDGDKSNYNPSAAAATPPLPAEPWVFLRGNIGDTPSVDYSTTGNFDIASSQTTGDFASSANVIDRIKFSDGDVPGTAQEYQISNIQLTDSRKVFLGGSAGSWNFDQFNTSINDYVYWKTATDSSPEECLVFNNCPAVNYYGDKFGFINVNQQIDKTINQFEQYKIKFTHSISENSTAKLAIYYYNSKGFGFKISGIDHTMGVATGKFDLQGNKIREVGFNPDQPLIVTIGELDSTGQPVEGSTWSNVNEFDSTYEADLVNSFVIAVQGDETQRIDGTIDNISMQQAFTMSYREPRTVTFSEKVNGWTSFKSFIPENGLSLSKKYFTFDKGALYQHYVPKKGNSLGEYIDGNFVEYEPKEANNYNIFYGVNDPESHSSITAVLNQEPSIVKTFNTLNYEGTQAHILKPSTVYKDGLIVKSENDLTNTNNAITLGLGNLPGWSCEDIKTDLDVGTVSEFIKKEGKWFNFIKGKSNTDIINTNLFSVQGLGFIDSIEIIPDEPEVGVNNLDGNAEAIGGSIPGGTAGGNGNTNGNGGY